MKIQTDRLSFRPVSANDLIKVHELHSLPETDEYNTLGLPETILETEAVIQDWVARQSSTPQASYIFCLDLIEIQQFIGLIGLNIGRPKYRSGEVWFKLHKDYWGNGYTTEALKKLLDFGFNELALHRIEAGCAIENIASKKVLEKVGMQREGMKRKNLPIRGEWKDNYCYAVLDEDFRQV